MAASKSSKNKGFEIIIKDKGLSVLFARVAKVPDDAACHVGVMGDPELVKIAAYHELGGKGRRPPMRSFLRRTAEAFKRKYAEIARAAYAKFLDGTWTMDQALTAVGIEAVSDVRRTIIKSVPPALADSTIRQKERKGLPRPRTALYGAGKLYAAIRMLIPVRTGGK